METRERRLPGAGGWALAGFLGIVIVLETIALTVIAWFISTPLAVAVPLVVAAIALAIVRDTLRHADPERRPSGKRVGGFSPRSRPPAP